MFVDNVKITVRSGKGGDGSVAFRHEKYVPLGGPAGGDGGRGGDIILRADEGMNTLMDFRYKRIFKADPGQNGQIKAMYGRKADPVFIVVPTGTAVYDEDTGKLIGDLVENNQELVVAKGGKGGRGNIHFANSKNRAPEVAENGEPGQEKHLRLELRLIADVGLVGFPSVGKSTLLSVATSAKPKIAAYHFTTLNPNLGMVKLDNGNDFVIADLPGLIEGASNGVGLGIQFLRHVERTRVILHLVDMDPENGRDPYEDYLSIRKELGTYDENILSRPEIIVPTKLDIAGSEERLAEFKEKLPDDADIFAISSIQHTGVKALLNHTSEVLSKAEPIHFDVVSDETVEYNYQPKADKFKVQRVGEHDFEVTGDEVERMLQMSNLDHQDGIMRFARKLKSMGVEDALMKAGAESGDSVTILDFTFEFI
ncbi:GTPase ObgE [Companilactobacillus sp.]|jgi:GTP-binding protein|uniref:GTPase ObgE n=1 Tax=Companilactobacillus sp. TaxID=2767905 RepID=UPI0025C66311|nr:GTPase ObgE [Companilactobacillus sp.]MCH4008340.1 GTPase ObgE [Companilactobacillus sp.]MCH4051481.1 GTPase ObgE [Companilactobacillus sp.]MCH4076283.1 GTPase ObgE [Companilactobacillus sp.]MCH4124858.1 GTPase ObgE [Companilactobacillus sp.]MCH4131400.1 GTPase ObgE [Companilactobacillus sp.]